jgi:aryl-alcohol dehydrogenase-like predicted oxidoreductase
VREIKHGSLREWFSLSHEPGFDNSYETSDSRVKVLLTEKEVLPTLKELGIGFVPFSPLGKGFLTGKGIESIRDHRSVSSLKLA